MTAALTIGILALICAFALCISVTVLVSRALSSAFRTVESMHERNYAALSDVLDRLMAIKWEDYVAMKNLEPEEEGGFYAPEDLEGDEGVEVQTRNFLGRLTSLSDEQTEADDNMNRLLDEDFPREGSAV